MTDSPSRQLDATTDLARALKQLVNAGLPILPDYNSAVDLDPEHPFWIAARNARATLDTWAEETGVNGDKRPL